MTRHHRPLRALSALLMTSLLVSACGIGGRDSAGSETGENSTVGVSDDSVKIGAHFPLTGVAAPGYSEIPSGARAYFDYVNEQGGIHGREIEYLVKDDAYNPTNTTTVATELVLKEEIFAMLGGLGTPTHGAIVDFMNEEQVPDLMVSSGSTLWGEDPKERPMTFGWQPAYEIEAKVLGEWIKKHKPDAKIGLFLQDDDLGANGESGLRRYVDDQIVKVVKYSSGNTDIAAQIAALKSSGADLVVGFNTPSYTALSQLSAKKIGYEPTWMYTNVGSDPKLVGDLLAKFSKGSVGDNASALDGMYTTEYIPGVDSVDNPWTKLWKKVWKAHGGKGELTNYRIYGMSQAYAFVTALQATGRDLTREGIVQAIEEGGESWEGPQLAPFLYGKDSHFGISGVEIVRLKKGIGVSQGPVRVSKVGDAPIEDDASGSADDAPPPDGIPKPRTSS